MIKSPKSYCFSDRPCRECRPLSCALLPTLRSIFLTTQKGSHRRCVCRLASAVYQDSYRECTRPCPLASQLRFPVRQCTLLTALVIMMWPFMFCNALCCQLRASHLQAYAMVAKGLFFRIPSLRSECYNLSNATLSSCVRPPCVHFDAKNTGGLVVWLAPVFSNIFCNEI